MTRAPPTASISHMDQPTVAAPRAPLLSHAGKVVTAIASTGAALVSIVGFLVSYGVIGEEESRKTVGNLGVTWVGLRPAADTATAIGDTLHLAATITDKNGAVVINARPTWTTDDDKVATVLPDGSVIARGSGATTVTVAVGDRVAKSRVVVRQRVASIDVAPASGGDSAFVVPEADRRALRARVRDARGYAIVGLPVRWRIADSSVADVDSAGIVTGRALGRTMVAASIGDATFETPVTVVATAASIGAVGGTAQRAAVGAALPQPVVVRVSSRRGRPVEGALVSFRLAEGQGTLSNATALTDAEGRARTQWTLGGLPGRQTMLASVAQVDSAVAVVAEADPVATNARVSVESMSGPVGKRLPAPVVVRVVDSTGRPLGDVPLAWVVLDGGRVDSIDIRTDSLGEARATWTLGPRSGTQRLRVQVGSGRGSHALPPVMVSAAAIAGAPATLAITGGDAQRGTVGATLDKALTVRALDAAGNGVAGVAVTLAPSAGTVPDTIVHTDSNGVARVRWTLGRVAGEYRLAMRVASLRVQARARATAAAAANLAIEESAGSTSATRTSGTRTGTAHAKARRLVATVTDEYGNPVVGAHVRLSTASGTVTPARAVSDGEGHVRATWTPRASEAERTLSGTVAGTTIRGALVVAGDPATAKPLPKPTVRATATKKPAKPVATTGTKAKRRS